MYKTIIELKYFGVFEIKKTLCIMVSEEEFKVDDLIKEFCSIMNIPSIKGLPNNIDFNKMTADLFVFLEKKGFSKLETTEVCISE